MTGFGPIFQLQLLGTICPCLEKSENKSARQAVAAINRACRRVEWQPGSNRGGRKGGFLGGLFGKGGGGGGGGPSQQQGPCLAKVVLRDSGGDGQPELFVDPLRNTAVPDDDDDDDVDVEQQGNNTSPRQQQQQFAGYKLNIKLRRVDKVSLDETTGQIVLTAKKVGVGREAVAKELLRFVLLQQSDDDDDRGNAPSTGAAVPVTSDARNSIMHHFMVITEWERQRRADLQRSDPDGYYYSDEEDDDENQPNFLQARAQKAAHFAKREVEMQRTKKEREKRKAQLVAESGGLKYTAIAMANMQT